MTTTVESIKVVGVSRYQDVIWEAVRNCDLCHSRRYLHTWRQQPIPGQCTSDATYIRHYASVSLSAEPNNPASSHAIVVRLGGFDVGHLADNSRPATHAMLARSRRSMIVQACIVGKVILSGERGMLGIRIYDIDDFETMPDDTTRDDWHPVSMPKSVHAPTFCPVCGAVVTLPVGRSVCVDCRA